MGPGAPAGHTAGPRVATMTPGTRLTSTGATTALASAEGALALGLECLHLAATLAASQAARTSSRTEAARHLARTGRAREARRAGPDGSLLATRRRQARPRAPSLLRCLIRSRWTRSRRRWATLSLAARSPPSRTRCPLGARPVLPTTSTAPRSCCPTGTQLRTRPTAISGTPPAATALPDRVPLAAARRARRRQPSPSGLPGVPREQPPPPLLSSARASPWLAGRPTSGTRAATRVVTGEAPPPLVPLVSPPLRAAPSGSAPPAAIGSCWRCRPLARPSATLAAATGK